MTTTASAYPNREHARIAEQARELLAAYRQVDPELALPNPSTLADTGGATRAQQLLRYLAQPFVVYEAFSSIPGQSTPTGETLQTVHTILNGETPHRRERTPRSQHKAAPTG